MTGQFKSSDITFDIIAFNIHYGRIYYEPRENFSSLIGGEEVAVCGYIDEQWKVQPSYEEDTVVPALQTFTVLEDIDLSSRDNGTDISQAIITWFTTNTTKLS